MARETEGFAIITADAEHGMIAAHDRCPLVLSPELTREWINPDTTAYRAERIWVRLGTQHEDFEWFPVDRAVGNVQ